MSPTASGDTVCPRRCLGSCPGGWERPRSGSVSGCVCDGDRPCLGAGPSIFGCASGGSLLPHQGHHSRNECVHKQAEGTVTHEVFLSGSF